MRTHAFLLVIGAFLLLAPPARAQTSCSLGDFSRWLNAGPSLIVAGSTPAFERRDVFAVARFGMMSGFFFRPEVTITRASFGQDLGKITGAVGVRVIPLGFRWGEGLVLGGGRGHSLGVMGGKGIIGWYVGAAYEWKPCDYGGVVLELTKALGTPLVSPAMLNVGFQFDLPSKLLQ